MKFFMEDRRMLIVETIAKIRRYYFVEERSIKQISRDLNLSRNTVRKVIRGGNTKHEYSRRSQPLLTGSWCSRLFYDVDLELYE
jgi:Mor family transcriptional regulator